MAVSFRSSDETIRRFNGSFDFSEYTIVEHDVIFSDTIPGNILLEFRDKQNIPVLFSRKIVSEVCADTTCRMLNIEIYWSPTGRYLGFQLPPGEFLSKTEHVKFTPGEYDRMHGLLGNANSPLAMYSLKELAPKKDTLAGKVDAVSSATVSAVLEHIVKGAVYTTYTLWHIIYGPTKREVEQISARQLDQNRVLNLLKQPVLSDKIWVLNHFPQNLKPTAEINNLMLSFISGNDVYLSERTLNAIGPQLLDAEMQNSLATVFGKSGFLQQRLILQKLKEAESFSKKAAETLSFQLKNMNAALIKLAIELYIEKKTDSEIITSNVAQLLENENRFISGNVFRYLQQSNSMSSKTRKTFEKYARKND